VEGRYVKGLVSVLMLVVALPSQAAIVTLSGDRYDFSFDDELLGLFGTPTVTGDTLSFAPTAFAATALNAQGAALTEATLNVQVSARVPGAIVPGLRLDEGGNYLRDGETTEVAVTGELRVTGGPKEVSDPVQARSPFDETGPSVSDWQALASVDLQAWDANEVLATLQDLLIARSLALGDIAFVQKLGVDLTVVPLPPAAWLFGSALFGLAVLTRRRQAVA